MIDVPTIDPTTDRILKADLPTDTVYDADLAAVATTGAYNDLSGKPTLGTAAATNTGTASGNVPVLGAGGVLAIGRLASGTPDGTKFVADDGTLKTPSGGGGAAGAWTAATLGSGVSTSGLSTYAFASRLSATADTVELSGMIKATGSISAGSTLLTLPVAHRPASNLYVMALVLTSTDALSGPGRLRVNTTGTVTLDAAMDTASVNRVVFEGLSFRLS